MAIHGSYMYVANYGNGCISKISLADSSIVILDWATVLYGPFGLVASGSYLYVSNMGMFGDGTNISKINLDDGSITDLNWASGLANGPAGLAIYGSYLYVAIYGSDEGVNTKISKISLDDGSIINADWITGLNGPLDLVIDGSYMYVSNLGDFSVDDRNTISKINIDTGSIVDMLWATGFSGPAGLAIYDWHIYVSNYSSTTGYISKISLVDGSITDLNWASDLTSQALFLTVYNSDLYASYIVGNTISKFALITYPISNICFIANTPVLTDQGNIPIEKIKAGIHTIQKKKIMAITKTVNQDSHLVCFNKNSLGLNYPNRKNNHEQTS